MRATDNTPQCRGKSEVHYDTTTKINYTTTAKEMIDGIVYLIKYIKDND